MIVVVGHEKGGVGKSSIAVNLAYRIAREGASVVVMDTDSTSNSVIWHARRSENEVEPPIPVVQNILSPAPAIIDLSSKYDTVVCDIGARDYEKLRTFSKIADLWVAPTQVGPNDLDSTVRLVNAFNEMGANHKRGKVPIVVMLNNVPAGRSKEEEIEAREYLQSQCSELTILESAIKHRKVWRKSQGLGRSIYEMPKRDAEDAVLEFEAFFQEAVTHLKK